MCQFESYEIIIWSPIFSEYKNHTSIFLIIFIIDIIKQFPFRYFIHLTLQVLSFISLPFISISHLKKQTNKDQSIHQQSNFIREYSTKYIRIKSIGVLFLDTFYVIFIFSSLVLYDDLFLVSWCFLLSLSPSFLLSQIFC